MDHHGISNTVDSTGKFMDAGVATADVSSCSGFPAVVGELHLRNLVS
jgi:hypothetical protein